MVYVCYYHATEDRVEHGITDLDLPDFLAQEPYARVLAWIPVAGLGVDRLIRVDGLLSITRS